MSTYSGKCDLADHISGMGGWFDKNGNPVKIGDPDVHVLYSDEWLDFLAFKKATGGVMYQHKRIKLTPWNHEDVKKLCKEFDYQEHIRIVPDKRLKNCQREETYLTYTYWDKEYTLKELNKKGIWITIDIHFDTLLDLIPYYPYLVSMCYHSEGKEIIYISDQSFVDEELDGHLEHGWYSDFWQHYKKNLQDHYREVVLEYYNPEGREILERLKFIKTEEDRYLATTAWSIDSNFEAKWQTDKSRWTSPKIVDEHTIEMSKEDFEHYLGDTVLVYYVKAKNNELEATKETTEEAYNKLEKEQKKKVQELLKND